MKTVMSFPTNTEFVKLLDKYCSFMPVEISLTNENAEPAV